MSYAISPEQRARIAARREQQRLQMVQRARAMNEQRKRGYHPLEVVTCATCPGTFTRMANKATPAETCPLCRAKEKAARMANRERAAKVFGAGKLAPCRGCGKAIPLATDCPACNDPNRDARQMRRAG